MMEEKVGKKIISDDIKKEVEIEITNTNVDVDSPEERPGVGYEIYDIGIGTDN
ncbi:hypothetical protein [Clostridium sp. KNHs205]|jgi:hypothetical protein|uniref:hypothetical protein n=1 Tax=Clostridium sp. KNHs205 TaxID=1449050 RepID=UPI000A3FA4A6|nr:hypothetical protein [Clostridium sp. KNHs205]